MPIADMRELGSTGLLKSGGHIQEEFLRELQGHRWHKVVREMRQDAIIGAVLLAIELSLRQVELQVEPADDTPQAAELAAFVSECLADMSASWADTLAEITTMIPYGYAPLELVYKRRNGDNRDTGKASKYTDGRIGWRKWAIRSQDSLDHWEFDEEGGLQGFWQVQEQGPPVLIPIEKALLFRTTSHKNSPEGRSALRSAYTSWFYKVNIQRIEAIGIERDLAGLPVAYVPPSILAKEASADEKNLLATIKEIVTNIRRDEQEGVVWPLAYNDEGKETFRLELLTSGGRRQFDTGAVITRYDQKIAMSVLADFIMLGHDAVGSYALSATKSSLFKSALEAWLISIADVINTHAIPRLLRLNGMAVELAPKLAFGSVGEVDLEDVVQFIKEASGAGMSLFPSLETENHLRRLVNLPPIQQQEYEEREAQRQAQADAIAQGQRAAQNDDEDDEAAQDEEMSRSDIMAQLAAAQRIIARGA